MSIASVDPSTGKTLKTFQPLSDSEIDRKLERAEMAFRTHRRTSFRKRAEKMLRAAEILESKSEAFARIMAVEMGKPLNAGVEEARKCARCCRFYAENAERFL